MHLRRLRSGLLAAVLSASVVLVGGGLSAAPSAAAPQPGAGTPVTVMTRNLYIGGDITRPLTAVDGRTGLDALLALGHANHQLRSIVDVTSFPARATALAREIAATEPDVVGLQEVATWAHGPLELGAIGVPNAETVDYDFLDILQGDLAALGADYRVAVAQTESDVEGPAFAAAPVPQDPTARDVRLTVRDVLLVKSGRVKVQAAGGDQYDTRVSRDLAGASFTLVRGYAWADVQVGTKRLRVIDTHLESLSSDVALAQAHELLTGPAAVPGRPVVVVCDCNSDPLRHDVEQGSTVPHSAPYDLLVAGGFHDGWLSWSTTDPGFTSGFGELVDDPDTSAIDHRIDLVLTRAADGGAVRVDRAAVVGVDQAERVGGLWPSDHAGVVLRLRP